MTSEYFEDLDYSDKLLLQSIEALMAEVEGKDHSQCAALATINNIDWQDQSQKNRVKQSNAIEALEQALHKLQLTSEQILQFHRQKLAEQSTQSARGQIIVNSGGGAIAHNTWGVNQVINNHIVKDYD